MNEREPTVLFVCEHGSAKSLIARLLFERAAKEAGLDARAESRGTVSDEAVPDRIKNALRQDGFETGSWRPKRLAGDDLQSAERVVVFDVPLGAAQGSVKLERWDGMPAVSENYAVAREAIRGRVGDLVRRLKAERDK